MKKTATLLAVAALALGVTACGDGTDDETTTTEAAAAGEGVQVTGQWARTSPMSTGNGAAYLNLVAAEDDALVGASVDPSVAATVEIHETVMADDSSMGDMSDDSSMADDSSMGDMADDSMSSTTMADGMGEMKMQEVAKIELPAGEKVELKPGGYHIMLIDLAGALEEGGEIEITLDFEKSADLVVKVPVLTEAPE